MTRLFLLLIVLHLTFLSNAQTMNGDCLWVGAGAGISGTTRTIMLHAPLTVTYLRRDTWGVTLRGELNGRIMSKDDQSKTMINYGGWSVLGCYNLLPLREQKLLCRVGLSHGSGFYRDTQVATADVGSAIITTTAPVERAFESYGIFLGMELLLHSGNDRSASIEGFINLNNYTYAGIALKFNVGAL